MHFTARLDGQMPLGYQDRTVWEWTAEERMVPVASMACGGTGVGWQARRWVDAPGCGVGRGSSQELLDSGRAGVV